jgi:diguanylate cyclase (GGDEF)-like protein/PAS domain S-box-containing protein
MSEVSKLGVEAIDRRSKEDLRGSEMRYRRLFETAQDGILIVDAETGQIDDVNPFLMNMLDYSREQFVGKKLWEIGALHQVALNQEAFRKLQAKRYARYENLPLRAKAGRQIEVEFVSNIYEVSGKKVIQCNIRDISDRRRAERRMSRTDALTGLANRQEFLERVEESLARVKRGDSHFAVLYLDVDHFRDINNTLSNPVADKLLQMVADRLKKNLRQTDLAARFGGDEFAILQARLNDPANAGLLAANILRLFAEPFNLDGNPLHITMSIGIALSIDEPDSADAMLTQADLALCQAKEEGRNQFCFHSAELTTEVHQRVTISEELRGALDCGEMELYYQPQVEGREGRIVGLESLIRWNHPKRGLVSPAAFISIAEKTGIMPKLGNWVFQAACRQIKTWRDLGVSLPVMAINVSAAQIKSASGIVDDFAAALAAWGVAGSEIELELTESILMDTTKEHGEEFDRIRAMGTGIAIDDFGTGYSSLNYLRAYPITRLKIAQPFIDKMIQNPRDAAVVRAAIALARTLDIHIIAEGVETREQWEFLLAEGCSAVQGYYFCRPKPAAQIEELLRQGRISPP